MNHVGTLTSNLLTIIYYGSQRFHQNSIRQVLPLTQLMYGYKKNKQDNNNCDKYATLTETMYHGKCL